MRRSWIIGIVAGAVVLVLLWYLVLFSPTSSDASAAKSKVAEEQRNQQELKNEIARLKELSANAPQQQADLRALQAAIPQNPDLGQFILQANEIASSSGIQWLSISPTPPAASTGGANSTIAVSMQIQGGFFQLLDYLNRLEDLDRLVIVDSISVTAAGGSTGTGASGSSGSASATTFDTGSSDGAPSLSVTLTGRMFTQAAAASSSGGTATAGGGTTTGTFPSSGSSSGSSGSSSSGSSSSSSSNSSTGNS
jgi:Tfp pilus assembly protein PilO